MRVERIGIDLGNTITFKGKGGVRKIFPNAFEVIADLIKLRFGNEAYIVSKVTPEQEVRARKWLVESRFHEITRLPETNIRFCEKRYQKGFICAQLGITHFVDDRAEVHAHLYTVANKVLFNGREKEIAQFREHLVGVIQVSSWDEIRRLWVP